MLSSFSILNLVKPLYLVFKYLTQKQMQAVSLGVIKEGCLNNILPATVASRRSLEA